MDVNKAIEHIRNRKFMSGVTRSAERIRKTGEWFTPTHVVQQMLDEIEKEYPDAFTNPNETFIDPTGCGDGQFLGEILIRKLENGIDFEQSLTTIFGVELQSDNCKLARERLLCGSTNPRHIEIVEKNIVCADIEKYHFRFDNSYPYDDEVKQKQQEELFSNLFE